MKKMAVSFASSDGCMPMPPTPSHRRAPLTGARKYTATSASATKPSPVQMNADSL